MIKIIIKKTGEITAEEWDQITGGFNSEFIKDKRPEDLKKYYEATVLGFSYHALALAETGEFAGHTTFAPMFYKQKNGERILTVLSGGSYVKKKFRSDIFIFKDMYMALAESAKNDGVLAVLGVPNKNSFKYFTKLLNAKFLYNLPYYVLPLRLNKLVQNKTASVFSFLILFAVKCYLHTLHIFSFFFNSKEKQIFFTIDYSEVAFLQRFNETYNTVETGKYRFTYKIYNEKDISTAYIFDFTESGERTSRSLIRCCNYIACKEKADLLAFVGRLDLTQPVLMKLPVKKEPQQLPLTIDVLADYDHPLFEELGNTANWNFGLMNFDVR